MRWRRLFRVGRWHNAVPLPIGAMPNLRTRLAYLRLSALILCEFLRLGGTFVTLRDLHVDIRANDYDAAVLAPPDYDRFPDIIFSFPRQVPPEHTPIIWAPCPGLEEITLFASDAPIGDLEPRRVAFLAHALGQLDRPAAEKAALTLVGINFQQHHVRALLDETVATVRERAFAGRGFREDYEERLWEHEC
ncbi:hypothetical protein AURDEDRAFT_113475 [Auricularia subglabra TFB-10046 SS5]|nr:hypothetical protein AURDEDRAFT_113475 [Auricularia subglabra TFB-10046 SS5]